MGIVLNLHCLKSRLWQRFSVTVDGEPTMTSVCRSGAEKCEKSNVGFSHFFMFCQKVRFCDRKVGKKDENGGFSGVKACFLHGKSYRIRM